MAQWKSIITRVLATGNLALAVWGYYILIQSLRLPHVIPPNWLSEFPHTKPILHLMFAISGLLLSLLVWGSIQLLRAQNKGAAICCIAYGLEILYWFIDLPIRYTLLWFGNEDSARLGATIIANGPLGKFAISAQMEILYPIFGLIVLSITHWNFIGRLHINRGKPVIQY
jgi:hypothetical protein